MKKRLRDKLPFSIRKFTRRITVGVVGWIVRFVGDALNIAVSNGLDLKRAWPWDINLPLQTEATTPKQLPDVEPEQLPDSEDSQTLSVGDFLFLMDAISKKQDSATHPAGGTRASVIIPVFNKVEYTLQCIRSLMAEVDFNEHEIIVVNNASEDETARVLAHLGSFVRTINNAHNSGFVQACNQGANAARGRYLVFLNNDTVVQPGWLNHLLETIEDDDSIGAVGSMLVYPDGRLQEAGGGVWIDGTAFNYGHRQDPEDRKFNFRREVDYCSASSLLVRKDLFHRLGGFDARYAPAYYEDTDLCFGIRSLGFKVVYQPMSRVIHYEGITAGTDITAGFKRYQEINRHKFVKKWKETLRHEHLENDPDNASVVANRRRGPRILVFDSDMLSPDKDAGSLRMQLILKSLVQRWQPVFIPLYSSNAPKYEKLLGKDGIEVAEIADYKRLIKEGDVYAAILSRAAVADALLPTIRKLDRNIKIIFDTVDVHFLRLEREYKLTGDEKYAEEAMLLKKQETQSARTSDQVWCVTSDDKNVLEREAPEASFEIIPTIHALHGRGESFDDREGLLFIGNFNHRPNKDAVHFFIEDVFPRVKERIPNVKFYLVGSNMPEEITKYHSEDVVVMGYVPDVAPLFGSCRVFVSPLRYGGGMKGKIGQAISYGLPVVTTAIGAEGMGLRHNHEALIADQPEDFINAVCQAYTDRELWQRLADNGYRHIGESFAPQVVEEKIQAALERLGKEEKRRDKVTQTIDRRLLDAGAKADGAVN